MHMTAPHCGVLNPAEGVSDLRVVAIGGEGMLTTCSVT